MLMKDEGPLGVLDGRTLGFEDEALVEGSKMKPDGGDLSSFKLLGVRVGE